MENISREQIDACCAFLDSDDDARDCGLPSSGRREVAAIALKHLHQGTRGVALRRVVKQEFRDSHPDYGLSPIMIMFAIKVLVLIIEAWFIKQ